MIELEERLRSALADLAEDVPPSRDAMARLVRRLAARRRAARRRPALAAAGAAVLVMAGVAIPILQERSGQQGSPTAPPSTPPPSSSSHTPGLPAGATGGPFRLATFLESGREWGAWAYVSRDKLCVVGVPGGQALDGPIRHPNSAGCARVHDRWPADQPRPKVAAVTVLGGLTPDSGPLPGLLLFVAPTEVTTLEVRAGDSTPVPIREVGRTDGLTLFLADFGTSTQGYGYTARDASGKVIEEAIT